MDTKLQQMANEIKENINSQVNQLTMNLIDGNKKGIPLQNEPLMLIEELLILIEEPLMLIEEPLIIMEDELNPKTILTLEIPIIKNLSKKSLDEDKIINDITKISNHKNKKL